MTVKSDALIMIYSSATSCVRVYKNVLYIALFFEAINAYKVNQNDVIQFHSCMCIPHRNLLANVRVIIMYNGLT